MEFDREKLAAAGFITEEDSNALLPEADRVAATLAYEELLAEYQSLQAVRQEVAGLQQEEVAERMSVTQSTVSRLEGRNDVHVKTLARYLAAMGGKLEIRALFPGKLPVVITAFDAESSEDKVAHA